MKKIIRFSLPVLAFLFSGINLSAQGLQDLSFGTDSTFDVITWNIQNFPKDDQTTIDYVKQIIENVDADLLALQEIDDTVSFEQMANDLDGYKAHYTASYYTNLTYLYKAAEINIDKIYEIFTSYSYSTIYPRCPVVMEFTFKNKEYVAINNHFKCCGDGILDLNDPGDEEYKRYYASKYLKEYIDDNFPDKNVILIGDLNDELTDNEQNNVFQDILDDPDNYLFADMEIANSSSSEWSYPDYPSHLDHILITNELFDEFELEASEIRTIKPDDYISGGWYTYDSDVSDHRPVGIKLYSESTPASIDETHSEFTFSCFPNPFNRSTTFTFSKLKENAVIKIFSVQGKLLSTLETEKGQSSVRWNPGKLPPGLYFARIVTNENKTVTRLLLKK
jgi:endonuclease/exonuclease/phosphatase family metal-dependent hydrolase